MNHPAIWCAPYRPLTLRPDPSRDNLRLGRTGFIATYNYEIDSLAYFIRLSYRYWKATSLTSIFTQEWIDTVDVCCSFRQASM